MGWKDDPVVSSTPSWQNDPIVGQEEKEESGNVASGVGETVLSVGSNMLLAPFAGLRGLGTLATGGGLEKAVQDMAGVQQNAYKPRTDVGKRYTENTQKVLNLPAEYGGNIGESLAGNEGRLVGEIAGEFVTDLLPFGLLRKGKTKPPTANKTVEAMRAAQEAKKPPTAPETEVPLVDTRTGKQLSKEAYEAALRERELQRTSAFNRHEDHPNLVQESPIDRMVRELGGEPLPKETTGPDTPITRMAADLTSEKTPESIWEAQEAIDARQRSLEEGVVDARTQDEAITDVSHRQMGPEDTTPSTGQFSLDNFKKRPISSRGGLNRQRGAINLWQTPDPNSPLGRLSKKIAYHAGDLGFGRDTVLGRMAGRSTGHFGTGTYFTEDQAKVSGREGRTVHEVDLSGYNLARPDGRESAKQLHDGLKGVNDLVHSFTESKLDNAAFNIWVSLLPRKNGVVLTKENVKTLIKEAVEETTPKYDEVAHTSKYVESASTTLMRKLGYDGVDVRGIDGFDNTQYGSVVYGEKFTPKTSDPFKSQRGSINLWSTPDPDSIVGRISRAFKEEGVDLIDQNLIPPNPELQSVIDTAKAEGPKGDGKFLKNLQSGSTSVAMKTRSPLLLAGSRIGQNALKMIDIHVRNYVMPAENAVRKLNKQDIQTLHEVMLDESRNRQMFDKDILAEHLNPDQLIAYDKIRKMQENQLEQVNAARKEKGLEPIDAHEAYLASRWQGDFRRPVYQKVGEDGKKLVWYLAANTKMGLASETKNLLKYAEENGIKDIIVDESLDHQVHTSRNKTDLEATYSTMIDLLGRDDPAVKAMAELVEQAKAAEAYNAFGTKKHFENKVGIRGFVGDRPWKNPQQEAISAFEEQFQQSKNAYSWAFTQKAVDGLTKLASDPDLVKMQPKNVAFLRDYAKTLLGMSETKLAKALDDSFRSAGVSPKILQQAVGSAKSYFILTKLGASVGNMVVNTLQTANIPSYLSQMVGAGYKGNPISALATGLFGGPMMAVAHYAPTTSRAMIPDGFLRSAVDYAEANGVTARSIVDEAPIGDSQTITGKAVRAVGHTLSGPETLARSVAFMSYAQMLNSSGKFTKAQWPEMFRLAEEYTNKSMVDYRQTEHAMIYGKAGTVGKALNVLQTYPMSFWNQYSFMAREAVKGNPWGLLTMLPTHYLLAGIAGIPAAEALDKLYKLVKDNLLSTETWAELNESPFWRDPKAWLIDQMGQGYYGKLSVDTGINWTSRLGAPSPDSMVMAPGGAAFNLGEQAVAVGKAVMDPTNSTKWAQAGMKTVPVALQGLLEQSGAMKDHTYVVNPATGARVYQKVTDLAAREGQYERSPEEEKIRNFSLRGHKEVMTRDMMYSAASEVKLGQKKAGELPDRIYDALRRGDQQKANTLASLYVSISKEANSGATLEEALKRAALAEYTTTDQKAALGIKESINKAVAYARARRVLEEVK